MKCEDTQRFIFDYLEGRLSEPARKDFEAHLASCPKCKEAMEDIERQEEFLRDLGQVEARRIGTIGGDLSVSRDGLIFNLPVEELRESWSRYMHDRMG